MQVLHTITRLCLLFRLTKSFTSIRPGSVSDGPLTVWPDRRECELLRDRLGCPDDAFSVIAQRTWRFAWVLFVNKCTAGHRTKPSFGIERFFPVEAGPRLLQSSLQTSTKVFQPSQVEPHQDTRAWVELTTRHPPLLSFCRSDAPCV